MAKKIYLIILSFITMICVIVGIAHYGFNWDSDGRWINWRSLSGKVTSDTVNIETGSNVDLIIDMDVADIDIKQGSAWKFSYECSEGLEPAVEVKDGAVTITQKRQKHSANLFGKNEKCKVVLVVPQKVELGTIKADLAMGDIDMYAINCTSCDITCNMGDCDIESCNLGKTLFTCNMGDCDIMYSSFVSFDASMNMGDIDLNCSMDVSDWNIELKCNMGEVQVNDDECGSKFQQSGDAEGYINIANDMGDIELEY